MNQRQILHFIAIHMHMYVITYIIYMIYVSVLLS